MYGLRVDFFNGSKKSRQFTNLLFNSYLEQADLAKENDIEGTVYVQFVVDKSGAVGQVKVLRPVDKYLDKEALRVVSSMPKWKPGKQNGKEVAVYYTVPIRFQLQ